MQHTTKCMRISVISAFVASVFSTNLFAEESATEADLKQSSVEENCGFMCDVSGSASLTYQKNAFDYSSYRSVQNISWNGSLRYKLSDKSTIYGSSGGYRVLEENPGTWATDSVIGVSYSSLFGFGETGNVGTSMQFTIPTSEASQDNRLNTAVRVSLPVRFNLLGINTSITPNLKKNFHDYKTANGRVLSEWTYSLSLGLSKSFGKLSLRAGAFGGNGISYYGNRQRSFSWQGSLGASYPLMDSLSLSLSAATTGVYSDAERGTLGNVDLFDLTKASYSATLSYSF